MDSRRKCATCPRCRRLVIVVPCGADPLIVPESVSCPVCQHVVVVAPCGVEPTGYHRLVPLRKPTTVWASSPSDLAGAPSGAATRGVRSGGIPLPPISASSRDPRVSSRVNGASQPPRPTRSGLSRGCPPAFTWEP